jgi:hypothetical protein
MGRRNVSRTTTMLSYHCVEEQREVQVELNSWKMQAFSTLRSLYPLGEATELPLSHTVGSGH